MSWFTRLLSPIGLFSGGKKKDPYANLLAQLNPLITAQTNIATKESDAGLASTGKAAENLDYVSKFMKDLLEGSDDNILKMFNTSELTQNIDENAGQLNELGVRGGRRAAVLGNSYFDRDSAINKMLQQIRFGAPDKIANIAQILGNLGLGELSASTGSSAAASNVLFGVEQLKQADKDRKAELIGSIFEAIGAVAGGIACVSLYGSHIYVPTGKIAANLIEIGDEVISFDKETKQKIIRKVIRKRITPRQITKIISNGNTIIRPTLTHNFYDSNFEEILTGNLDGGDLLTITNKDVSSLSDKSIIVLGEEKNDVIIFKLDNDYENYPFICNGYICVDDDIVDKR